MSISNVSFAGNLRGSVKVDLNQKKCSFSYNRENNKGDKFEPGSIIVSDKNPNEAFLVLSKEGGGCPCCDMDPDPEEVRLLPVDVNKIPLYSEDIKYYQGYSKAGQLNVNVSDY